MTSTRTEYRVHRRVLSPGTELSIGGVARGPSRRPSPDAITTGRAVDRERQVTPAHVQTLHRLRDQQDQLMDSRAP